MGIEKKAGDHVAPYDLTLFERESAAYASAKEHYLRVVHQAFAHMDSSIQAGGLIKGRGDQAWESSDIKLPWLYTLSIEQNGTGSVRYCVWSRSWSGRTKEFIASTAIFRNGTFDYTFNEERLEEFAKVLRLGFVDRVSEYASQDKKGRAEMLGQRQPSEGYNGSADDEKAEDLDELEEDNEAAEAD